MGLVWYAIADGTQHSGGRGAIFVGPILLIGAVWGGIVVWVRRNTLFQCHERGVVSTTWRGTKTLMYHDVGCFTYAGVRNYLQMAGSEGRAYYETQVTMRFEPLHGKPGDVVIFNTTYKYTDDELERLRDFICRLLAGHMAARLREGQTVEWTPQFAFTPEGLAVKRAEKDGMSGSARLVPYDRIRGCELKEGTGHFHFEGDFGRPVTELASAPNFFPGYHLLLILTGSDHVPTEVVPAS